MMNDDKWLKIQREYLEKQAPLRAAWIAGDEEAGKQLKALVAEIEAKCPPLTGTLLYIREDERQDD